MRQWLELRWRLLATAALLAIVVSPVVRDGDGVPLSSYPMYAAARSAEVEFVVAYAVDAEGAVLALSIEEAAGTSDPLIAETKLRREVAEGRGDALCGEVAGRVGGRPDLVEVEIRAERHDVVERVQGRPSVVTSETVARCPT